MAMMRPCHCVIGPPAGGVCTACGAVGPPLPSIERTPHIQVRTCKWTKWEDPDGTLVWNTGCGEDFMLLEDGPKENNYHYCPNCGGLITETNEIRTQKTQG